jgi:tRNA-Thr(GGU) m(6)t(6)A37 methyltransferase TsaA
MKDLYPPIGYVKTCFKEKFGTPRQAQMIPAAKGVLKLNPEARYAQALQELEKFSHVWLIFVFDRHTNQEWKPLIQSPRVDMPRVGVFASRSPHRPNAIGLSAVKLESIDFKAPGGIEIHLSGVDLLDNTPVLDIKPYLPYADIIPDANTGWAKDAIDQFPVSFSSECQSTLEKNAHLDPPRTRELIEQMLSWDPRPASQRQTMPIRAPETEGRIFRFRITRYDVEWQVRNKGIHVLRVIELASL